MNILQDIFDFFRSATHPEVDECYDLLYKECNVQLRKFCANHNIALNNIGYKDKQHIYLHRLSIKFDQIRQIYREVAEAREKYPEGFNLLFEQLFFKRMATARDCQLGKRDACDAFYKDASEQIQLIPFAGVSLIYYTYTQAFVNEYYSILYNDGEFSKYIYASQPSLTNFTAHLKSVFSIKEIPIEVADLSIDHVRLLHRNINRLQKLHTDVLRQKRYKEQIEDNFLRKKYFNNFLGFNGRAFDDVEYALNNLSAFDTYINEILKSECDKIRKYYPKGYEYYCRYHPGYTKSSIIEAKQEIRLYNQYVDKVEPYDKWEIRQKEYTEFCERYLLRFTVPSLTRNESYNPKYERLLLNGDIGKLNYAISITSLNPVCSNLNLDYSVFPEIGCLSRGYFNALPSSGTPFIDALYITNLQIFISELYSEYGKKLLVFIPSYDDNVHTNIQNSEFKGLYSYLRDNNISTLNLSSSDECDSHLITEDYAKYEYVLLFNLTPDISLLKRLLVLIGNLDEWRPAVFYCSLIYEISAIDLNSKIQSRKREIEEENRKRREAELRAEREFYEQKRREEERQKILLEERIAREEKHKIESLSKCKKAEHLQIRSYLSENNVLYFYHFTDRRNIESIRKNGGLYSWKYCVDHNIIIPYPGGNADSRDNDLRYQLQDYVRLSFCTDHPMMYRLSKMNYELVLLKIKVDVAEFESTLYSDMNATDSLHHHGGTMSDLMRIDISATRKKYLRKEDSAFKPHQAEVLVKTYIPIEYIENIDEYL